MRRQIKILNRHAPYTRKTAIRTNITTVIPPQTDAAFKKLFQLPCASLIAVGLAFELSFWAINDPFVHCS
jgi:hypothetical protein